MKNKKKLKAEAYKEARLRFEMKNKNLNSVSDASKNTSATANVVKDKRNKATLKNKHKLKTNCMTKKE